MTLGAAFLLQFISQPINHALTATLVLLVVSDYNIIHIVRMAPVCTYLSLLDKDEYHLTIKGVPYNINIVNE